MTDLDLDKLEAAGHEADRSAEMATVFPHDLIRLVKRVRDAEGAASIREEAAKIAAASTHLGRSVGAAIEQTAETLTRLGYEGLMAERDELKARLDAQTPDEGTRVPGHDHKPVQHRDGKPPWCNVCGLTAGGTIPATKLIAQVPGGPAYVGIMPASPETSRRLWTMYCRECGIEECMADAKNDERLAQHTEDHNRQRHSQRLVEPL
ncbi:MAG: hypothetical protein ACTJHU_11970 [Mycetocola sp.]